MCRNNVKIERVSKPVIMAVSLEASTPSVTCSAVEADPNPLGPANPVIKLKIFTIFFLQLFFLMRKKRKNIMEDDDTIYIVLLAKKKIKKVGVGEQLKIRENRRRFGRLQMRD